MVLQSSTKAGNRTMRHILLQSVTEEVHLDDFCRRRENIVSMNLRVEKINLVLGHHIVQLKCFQHHFLSS